MPINKSSVALSAIYKGSSTVTKAYKGTDQIYPSVASSYAVDYLVIAGGGGGGGESIAGGGGAGGLRTSWLGGSGGGGSSESSLSLSAGTSYNIIIGALLPLETELMVLILPLIL